MNVVIYNRVSTDKQGRSGLSDEGAEALCRLHAEREGWTVDRVEFEQESSRKTRPVLESVLEWCRTGPERGMIVAEMDRICRDLLEFLVILEDARKDGYVVHCVDLPFDKTTPEGKLMASIRGAQSEFERALISRRTQRAMARLKTRGVPLGRTSWKRATPRVIPDETREYIRGLRTHEFTLASGRPLSFRDIARRLRQEGVPTADGGTWGHSTVAAVCSAIPGIQANASGQSTTTEVHATD